MAVTDLPSFCAEVFDRVVAMEKLAVPGAQAGSYASYEYPYGNLYWTNRLESLLTPEQRGVDEFSFTFPIVMRLHTGYLGQGFDGALEIQLQTVHAPTVMQYFWARRDLVYQAGQARIPFFQDDAFDISCQSGLSLWNDDPAKQLLGVEFRLTTKARIQIRRMV